MSRIKRAKPSAALIVAVVALVAALGGGAVAGVAVTSLNKKETKKVREIAKKQAKKLDKKVELMPGPPGEKGEQGEQGPPGEKGEQGGKNAAEKVVVRESGLSSGLQTVSCMDGERVVGGGAATSPPATLSINGPTETTDTPSGWSAQATDSAPVNALVLCASP